MKTIKQEIYKGYEIIIRAEFKEDTTAFSSSEFESLDSVNIEVITRRKGYFSSQVLKGSVEEGKSKRKEMYDAFNKTVESLVKTAKEKIDKKVREAEMTESLPESLLQDKNKALTNQGKVVTLKENELVVSQKELEKAFKFIEMFRECR